MENLNQGQTQEVTLVEDPINWREEARDASLNQLNIGDMKNIDAISPSSSYTNSNSMFKSCFQNNLTKGFQFAFGCGEYNEESLELVMKHMEKKSSQETTVIGTDDISTLAQTKKTIEKDNDCTTSLYKRNHPASKEHQAIVEREVMRKSYKRQLKIDLKLLEQRDEATLLRDTYSSRHIEDDDVTVNTKNLSQHQEQNYEGHLHDYQDMPDQSTTPSYRKQLHQRVGWKKGMYSNTSSLDQSVPETPISTRQRLSVASNFTYEMMNTHISPTKGRHMYDRAHEAPFSDNSSSFSKTERIKPPQSNKNRIHYPHSPHSEPAQTKNQRTHIEKEKKQQHHRNAIKYHDASSVHDDSENENLMYY